MPRERIAGLRGALDALEVGSAAGAEDAGLADMIAQLDADARAAEEAENAEGSAPEADAQRTRLLASLMTELAGAQGGD